MDYKETKETKTQNNNNRCKMMTETQINYKETQINDIEMHKGDKHIPMDYKDTKKVTTKRHKTNAKECKTALGANNHKITIKLQDRLAEQLQTE